VTAKVLSAVDKLKEKSLFHGPKVNNGGLDIKDKLAQKRF
jgi:hypothetical protein